MKVSLKVLMVEDSASDIELIQFELRQVFPVLEVEVTSCEKDFTYSLLKLDPDVILSDFTMPSFDGLSALRIAQEIKPEIPFIFVSGTIGQERAIEALKCGATDYVLKDHLSGLIPKLKRALKEAKERSDKKKAEEELLKKHEQLIDAQEIAQLGNWEFNISTEELSWSAEVYKILGYKPYSITPTVNLFLSHVHPEDTGFTIESIANLKKLKMINDSYRIIRKRTKEIRHVVVKVKKHEGIKNKKVTVCGIIQDVTDIKETEARLLEANRDLKTFIYKSSHDLRGPVSSALGICELLKYEWDGSEKTMDYLNIINNCLKKLDYNVCTLSETMSIKDKKADIQTINFVRILHDVTYGLKFTEGFSKIKFITEGLKTNFKSDHNIIFSIFQNLIENSIKYQNKRRPDPFIKIIISKRYNGVGLEISDNGIGIKNEIKDKVFDMFYRGNDNSKGSGLGLYIVKNAVEKLSGTIKVKSTPKEGTTFSIFLPLISEGFLFNTKPSNLGNGVK